MWGDIGEMWGDIGRVEHRDLVRARARLRVRARARVRLRVITLTQLCSVYSTWWSIGPSGYVCLDLPISRHISPYLAISRHISPYLLTCGAGHISPYLPISPHISSLVVRVKLVDGGDQPEGALLHSARSCSCEWAAVNGQL